jgi:hypothetical protein
MIRTDMEKGSTLVKDNIEGLGHGKQFGTHGKEYRALGREGIFILHEDHRPTTL